MREIKFRAWDKKRNIYGNVTMLEIDFSEWFREHHAEHAGRVSLENPKNEQDCGYWGRWLDGVDLEQFTGLIDKNGQDIYEGDIVESAAILDGSRRCVNLVRFEDCAFIANGIMTRYQTYKIIGNVHENPELLK